MSQGNVALATQSAPFNTGPAVNSLVMRDNEGGDTNTYDVAVGQISTGYVQESFLNVTTTYTILGNEATWFLCNATGGAFAITLPAVASFGTTKIIIIKTDSSGNAVTVTSAGAEIIIVTGSAATTYALSARGNGIVINSNTVSWFGLKS